MSNGNKFNAIYKKAKNNYFFSITNEDAKNNSTFEITGRIILCACFDFVIVSFALLVECELLCQFPVTEYV